MLTNQVNNQRHMHIYHLLTFHNLYLTLTEVVETSANITQYPPNTSQYHMTPGFKPFTTKTLLSTREGGGGGGGGGGGVHAWSAKPLLNEEFFPATK